MGDSPMLDAQYLRALFQEVEARGKFEKKEALAVLSALIEIAERLKRVERVCEIQRSE